MLTYFAKKSLNTFAKKYDCDMDYMIELAEIYPAKFLRFGLANAFIQHFSVVPKELYFAVRVTASHIADCGTCTQMAINIAIEAGVERQQLANLILGDVENMNKDTLLGYEYAHAIARNDLDLMDIIDHIKIEYGKKGLWDVANAYNFGEFYPKLKRGLGEAVSCRRPTDIVAEILND